MGLDLTSSLWALSLLTTPPLFVRLTPFQTSKVMITGTSWAGAGKRWSLLPLATRWSQEANVASSIIWEHRSRIDVGLNSTSYVSVSKSFIGRDPQRHMIIKVSSEMVGFYGIGFLSVCRSNLFLGLWMDHVLILKKKKCKNTIIGITRDLYGACSCGPWWVSVFTFYFLWDRVPMFAIAFTR